MHKEFIIKVLVVVSAVAVVVQIANGAGHARRCKPCQARPPKKVVDRNGDHRVDRKERQTARNRLKKKAVVNTPGEKRADKNNDGIVGPKEKCALNHRVHKAIDFNNDGKITLAERKKYWIGKKAKVNTPFEKKYDSDGNGYLSGSEAKELLRDRLRIISTHGKAKVNTPLEKEYDVNGDGVIDRSEARAMREAVQ